MPFRLLIEGDVVDLLLDFSATKRRRFMAHFRKIQEYPGNNSQMLEPDDEGRILDVCIFEDIEIRYWIDDADRHVKIVSLTPNE